MIKSFRKYIDGAYIAAEVRLLRQTHKGAVVLVEGPNDEKLLTRFLHETATTEIAFGKTNALDALQRLEDEGKQGIIAILDLDFDAVQNIQYDCDNLFYADAADFDTMMFKSDALARYLAEYADQERLKGGFATVDGLRNAILEASAPLAACRLTSERMKLNLAFKKLSLDKFICQKSLKFDEDLFIKEVIAVSGNPCKPSDLKLMNEKSLGMRGDPWEFAHGHDVTVFVGVALREKIADRKIPQTWGSEIAAGLRLAFQSVDLQATALWSKIKNWEKSNSPYLVFA